MAHTNNVEQQAGRISTTDNWHKFAKFQLRVTRISNGTHQTCTVSWFCTEQCVYFPVLKVVAVVRLKFNMLKFAATWTLFQHCHCPLLWRHKLQQMLEFTSLLVPGESFTKSGDPLNLALSSTYNTLLPSKEPNAITGTWQLLFLCN